jgi:hypothetical protein
MKRYFQLFTFRIIQYLDVSKTNKNDEKVETNIPLEFEILPLSYFVANFHPPTKVGCKTTPLCIYLTDLTCFCRFRVRKGQIILTLLKALGETYSLYFCKNSIK